MSEPDPSITPRPGEPLRTGHILGPSLYLWARHSRVCWLFPLFLMLPYLFAERVLDQLGTSAGKVEPWGLLTAVVLLVPTLAVLQGMVSLAALRWVRGRETPSGMQLLSQAWSRFPSLLLISYCTLIAVAGGTLLLIIPGLIVLSLLWVAVPALLDDPDLTGFGALRRSVELTRSDWVRLLPVALLIPACGFLIQYPFLAKAEDPASDAGLFQLLAEVLGVGVLTLEAVAWSVAYHLLRKRAEPRPGQRTA